MKFSTEAPLIYTIGHSNRALGEFLDILKNFNIKLIIDVRRWPSSRKFPYFSKEVLRKELSKHGIFYVWLGYSLGGKRGYVKGAERIKCFKAEGYRNYAAYMKTEEWIQAFELLVMVAKRYISALLCAEKLPWRCHRKLISDALLVKGFNVIHILNKNKVIKHKFTKCARVIGGSLIYV